MTNKLPNQSNDHLQVSNLHVTLPKAFSQMWEEKELTLEKKHMKQILESSF